MTLYELTDDFMRLLEMMQDPEIDPDVLADTMEGLEGVIEDKAESYIVISKELESQADKFDAEIKRLTAQKTMLTNNAKRIKERLMNSMITMGKQKIQTEHFKLSVAKNGGLQPMTISDISEIPEEYIIREPKADTTKIREALMDGKKLDFARLEERGTHLSVR